MEWGWKTHGENVPGSEPSVSSLTLILLSPHLLSAAHSPHFTDKKPDYWKVTKLAQGYTGSCLPKLDADTEIPERLFLTTRLYYCESSDNPASPLSLRIPH